MGQALIKREWWILEVLVGDRRTEGKEKAQKCGKTISRRYKTIDDIIKVMERCVREGKPHICPESERERLYNK